MPKFTLESYVSRREIFRYASKGILALPLLKLIKADQAFSSNLTKKNPLHFSFISQVESMESSGFQKSKLNESTGSQLSFTRVHRVSDFFKGFNTIGPTNHSGGPKQVFAGGGADGSPLTSLDHLLASKWGETNLGRFALGVGSTQSSDGNLVSWKNGQGIATNDNPKLSFESLFGGSSKGDDTDQMNRLLGKKRLLDYLLSDYNSLKNELGYQERILLESHVESIDELEKQINRLIKNSSNAEQCLSKSKFEDKLNSLNTKDSYWPLWFHKPENTAIIASIHRQMMIEAISCGLTRVGLLQYGASNTQMPLNFEGKPSYIENHHSLSHEGGKAFEAAQKSIVEELALILQAFAKDSQTGENLLEKGLIYMASCLGDKPNYHNGDNIPCVIAGKAFGKFTGRSLVEGQDEPYNRVLLTIMDALGEKQAHVGNEKIREPLTEILN